MSLFDFCGKVACLFACLIVLVAVLMAAMLGFCLVLGAYESVSNPHASEDARVSYQNVTAEIAAGTAGMNQAVRNVTSGGT
jgi:flagellar basal body-associated protein FliL